MPGALYLAGTGAAVRRIALQIMERFSPEPPKDVCIGYDGFVDRWRWWGVAVAEDHRCCVCPHGGRVGLAFILREGESSCWHAS